MSQSLSPGVSIVPDAEEESGRTRKRARRCNNACNRCKKCVYETLPSRRLDSVSLNYIAALEERCAHLESALRATDPGSEDVQDHLQPSRIRRSDPSEETHGDVGAGSIDQVESHMGLSSPSWLSIAGGPQLEATTSDLGQAPSSLSEARPNRDASETNMGEAAPPSGQPTSYRADITSHEPSRAITPVPNTETQQQQRAETAIRQHVDRLSMKAFAETPYIDGLSGMSFAKIAKASMGRGKILSPTPFQPLVSSRWGAQRALGMASSSSTSTSPEAPEQGLADMLYRAAYLHVQARYPFMQSWKIARKSEKELIGRLSLVVALLLEWHKRRSELCVREQDLVDMDDRTGACFLWLVYAVGARHLTHGVSHDATAERYFAASRLYFDDVLARHDLLTVEALAMTAMYSFRADDGPSVWHLIGFAMRICIEYGLHRKLPPVVRKNDPLGSEVKSRVFWSIYTLDRLVSISLGRPLSISDIDIDAEEPLDIDCHKTDPSVIQAAYEQRTSGPRQAGHSLTTSMSTACHWIKLYRIRSSIVSRMKIATPMSDDEVRSILDELEAWKAEMPRTEDRARDQSNPIPILTTQRLLKGYYLTVTIVLRPNLNSGSRQNDPFLHQLAEAAAQCCELENQIIASPSPGHSMAALYSTFISGLTLLHALATQRDVVPARRSARAIRACSSVLVAYATLFPEAQSFRAMFESLVDGMEEEAEVATLASSSNSHGKHAQSNRQASGQLDDAHGHGHGQGHGHGGQAGFRQAADPNARDVDARVGVGTSASACTGTAGGNGGVSYVAMTPSAYERPAVSPAVPEWQKKVQDLGSMLQGNFQQDFVNLVTTFGYTPNPSSNMHVDPRTSTSGSATEEPFSHILDPTLSGGLDFTNMFDFAALFESN